MRRQLPVAGPRGFSLVEVLVAMFVLALAVAGAVSVVVVAGRSAAGAREKLLAGELARTALAAAEVYAEDARNSHGGALALDPGTFVAADALGPAGFQQTGPGVAPAYGWLWRAHSFDAATGLYSLDVWVFQSPAEKAVQWGRAPDSPLKREQTLLYLRSRLETRKP